MTADRPLADLSILVTRPSGQAETLCAAIEAVGGTALRLPLLEIVPVEEGGMTAELLQRRDYWDWWIFVSANAVHFALARGLPPDQGWRLPRVAAVGAATARALQEVGVRVDLIPKPLFNSESLLAAEELSDVSGRRILILRGVGGRDRLAEGLRARGAETSYAELYRRIPAARNAEPCLALWRQGVIFAVVVTSGEALVELGTVLGDEGDTLRTRTTLVVIGDRIANLARQQGWRQVAVVAEASDRGIVETLIRQGQARQVRRLLESPGANSEYIQ